MSFKVLPVLIVTITLFTSARAQDTLYKRDGSALAVKVKNIGATQITYKRFDNLNGPEYTTDKNDAAQIKYENGAVDKFEVTEIRHSRRGSEMNDAEKPKNKYGNNIILITPLAFIGDLEIESGEGIGIGYEISLDRRKMLSVYLPVLFEFNMKYSDNDYYYYHQSQSRTYTSVFFMPGIKFYPTGNTGIVRYAMGISFYANAGTVPVENTVYNQSTGSQQTTEYDKSYTVFGMMFTNSLNIFPTKHLCLGLDYNMGVPYIDNRPNSQSLGDALLNPLMQFSFKIGYRF